jgi:hypothetical protein
MTKEFLKYFLIVDFLLLILLFIFDDMYGVLNSQIAFISALVITYGSYISYKNNISKRISKQQVDETELDTIDKLEDPYDLYTTQINEQEEFSKEEIKQIIQEQKKKITLKDAFKNTISSIGAYGSLYRVGGYLVLIVGFFYLNNNHLLKVLPYLSGFLVIPLGIILTQIGLKLNRA